MKWFIIFMLGAILSACGDIEQNKRGEYIYSVKYRIVCLTFGVGDSLNTSCLQLDEESFRRYQLEEESQRP